MGRILIFVWIAWLAGVASFAHADDLGDECRQILALKPDTRQLLNPEIGSHIIDYMARLAQMYHATPSSRGGQDYQVFQYFMDHVLPPLHEHQSNSELFAEAQRNHFSAPQNTEWTDFMSDLNRLMDQNRTSVSSHLPQIMFQIAQAVYGRFDSVIIELNRPVQGDLNTELLLPKIALMYMNYAHLKGWQVDSISDEYFASNPTRTLTFRIRGKGVYAYLARETGLHRAEVWLEGYGAHRGNGHSSFVQARVDVHVYPEPKPNEFNFDERQVTMTTMRSSGPGGQNVQKRDTAVILTHSPSGLTAKSQEHRTQDLNRSAAMRALRAKVFERHMLANQQSLNNLRRRSSIEHFVRRYNLAHSPEIGQRLLDGHIEASLLENLQEELMRILPLLPAQARTARN